MGASGGGCVLVIAGADNAPAVRDALRTLGSLLDFSVDEQGLGVVSP